jgi:N-acetylglucosaminyldiphosphoundecaprenol N-acetyl-beta-D-mannosaminyltransferase
MVNRTWDQLNSMNGSRQEEVIAENVPGTVNILGIPFNRISMEDTLKHMTQWATSDELHHVVAVNPECVMIAQRDLEFRTVLQRASLRLADGVGIVWAAKMLGQPVNGRVTGVDTVRAFSRIAGEKGYRFFLLGAAPGTAEKVAAVLMKENAGLNVVGTFSGSPDPAEEDAICERIRHTRPHVLFVAYGAPKQDLWLARNQKRLGVPLVMGVGGTFDFIAGTVKRAPRWMQRTGLEWLFRLKQEPSRWRRMLRLPHFAILVIMDVLNVLVSKRGNEIKIQRNT